MNDSAVAATPTFRVWLRPLGATCRLRVEDPARASWLLDRLSRDLKLEQNDVIVRGGGTDVCTFHIACRQSRNNSDNSQDVEKLLRSLPQVQLMDEPE
jgi:hypothetical protein